MTTLVSKASVINGFAFLRSSADDPLKSFNRTFLEILHAFKNFGSPPRSTQSSSSGSTKPFFETPLANSR